MEDAALECAVLEDAEPIFELAIECERLYLERIARLKEDSKTNEATILSELHQRFAAWAAFLGVFAESRSVWIAGFAIMSRSKSRCCA